MNVDFQHVLLERFQVDREQFLEGIQKREFVYPTQMNDAQENGAPVAILTPGRERSVKLHGRPPVVLALVTITDAP
ncbi:hypothetical protein [Pseudaminobacter soli (ex Li et al. 2025)]|uniref:hypothetical protein n=1 Tax=Pseudaminobacter soli (ex Li et al. 2025) TaxID=1295366 RepID=UPI002475A852|nr:hypothetical protein [Mesorhizobium soli]